MVVRTYEDECGYLERVSENAWRIKKGFQPHMNVEGVFYVNSHLEKLMFDELRNACRPGMVGGFLPGKDKLCDLNVLLVALFKVIYYFRCEANRECGGPAGHRGQVRRPPGHPLRLRLRHR